MKLSPIQRWITCLFVLTTAGLLFSGYFSAIRLFTGTCAFNEFCPYFLGYPACWYGFGMFLIMFIVTTLAFAKKIHAETAVTTDIIVALFGMFFSGRFAIIEFVRALSMGGPVLSTCTFGFLFYGAIFIVALVAPEETETD
jgi:hypothetical protein